MDQAACFCAKNSPEEEPCCNLQNDIARAACAAVLLGLTRRHAAPDLYNDNWDFNLTSSQNASAPSPDLLTTTIRKVGINTDTVVPENDESLSTPHTSHRDLENLQQAIAGSSSRHLLGSEREHRRRRDVPAYTRRRFCSPDPQPDVTGTPLNELQCFDRKFEGIAGVDFTVGNVGRKCQTGIIGSTAIDPTEWNDGSESYSCEMYSRMGYNTENYNVPIEQGVVRSCGQTSDRVCVRPRDCMWYGFGSSAYSDGQSNQPGAHINRCAEYGHISNGGWTANEACCACGGGDPLPNERAILSDGLAPPTFAENLGEHREKLDKCCQCMQKMAGGEAVGDDFAETLARYSESFPGGPAEAANSECVRPVCNAGSNFFFKEGNSEWGMKSYSDLRTERRRTVNGLETSITGVLPSEIINARTGPSSPMNHDHGFDDYARSGWCEEPGAGWCGDSMYCAVPTVDAQCIKCACVTSPCHQRGPYPRACACVAGP